ncbi:hypothetical protein [Ectobacillus panaciterrae]|uniref:hypothetical protein n=1 Tax=Ectobacillus panaciterrae TaxID=363872 RepID=UPI0004072845|nr:hypothetical protein [Ectobacillus panaciterrae]
MTIFGYIFWGICIIAIVGSFWMQKKYKSGAPDKSSNQELHEEITKLDNSRNDPPRF